MKTHEQLFNAIKSDLLDILMFVLQNKNYDDLLNRLDAFFATHFNVSTIQLFLYEDNHFHQASSCQTCNGNVARQPIRQQETNDVANYPIDRMEPNEFADDTLMIRNTKREPIAMILVKSTEEWQSFAVSEKFKDFQLLVGSLIETIKETRDLEINSKNYRHLLEATKFFNSTLETKVIYEQLVRTVVANFESLTVELILSQEEVTTDRSYRLFDYSNELPSTTHAFMTGELTLGHNEKLAIKILNAPVKGKQGTYGILQLTAPSEYIFSSTQKEFVRSISESAGYAVENSSLYSQSHRLISDLQLVNDVSKKLTERLSRNEMVSYINEKIIATFNHEEIAFVSIRDGQRVLAKETSKYFYTDAGGRYLDYAEARIRKEHESIYIADLDDSEIEGFSPYRSLIITPMIIAEELVGYSVFMHTETYKFSFDDFKLAKSIVSHSSLALSNLALREKLQELANKDQLTGLFARGYLDRHMSESFENGKGGVFLLLDVDNFKQINDNHGHAVGDQVLKQTAKVLQECIGEEDVAGRWGGEEFALYVPGATLKRGKEVANRVLQQIPLATNPSITVSIGVSEWNPLFSNETYQQLFQQADEALYKAKSNGKNQVVTNKSVLAE